MKLSSKHVSDGVSTLAKFDDHIYHGYPIRASVDALCRDGAGLISRERVQRGRLTRQGTTS